MTVVVRRVGPESAEAVHRVVRAAFEARPRLDPPADALLETPASLRTSLAMQGGLLALADGEPVGALLLDPMGPELFLRRFGVLPDARGTGVAAALIVAATEAGHALSARSVRVLARQDLPRTVGFWEANGFVRSGAAHSPYVELARPLVTEHDVPDAPAMRELGRSLATRLAAGDVVVLSGELGAGKTTLAQGLGEGLGVRGGVTSPTFVISRVHPSLNEGPALVHVDAYRLGGIDELDDLDLDASLEEAVTVVEWGTGIAEALADSRLEVRIDRASGDPGPAPAGEAPDEVEDPRRVTVRGVGPRWQTPTGQLMHLLGVARAVDAPSGRRPGS